MTGMMLGAARRQMAIVMDGFISTAAAAIACGLAPAVRPTCSPDINRRSPATGYCWPIWTFEPILDLHMRLGEGTGAVLAMPVLEAAMRLYQEMATFASAGISGATA
jgi:nicotinate-nucleotide--dimethylbenzimidazole phosphoribosyltransferase